MRITFSCEAAAQAAVRFIEQYGYAAAAVGSTVVTDCPALLAVPVVGRNVGLHAVERVQLGGGPAGAGASSRGLE